MELLYLLGGEFSEGYFAELWRVVEPDQCLAAIPVCRLDCWLRATAARRFYVAVTTVTRAVMQYRATGSLERKAIPGRPRAIGADQEAQLRARLEAAPDATILEHCAWWSEHTGQQVGEVTMWQAVRRLGWTHNKRPWQPASGTRRSAPPGGQQWRRAIRSSSSFSMKPAPTLP